MSDEDPWKNWYQSSTGTPGADATQDISMSSRMPPPGGDAGGNPPRGSWPQQPPPSSSGGGYGDQGYSNQGRGGNAGYQQGGYQQGGYAGAPAGTAPPRSGRRWRFWGQPGRHGRRIVTIIVVILVLIVAGTAGSYFWIDGKLNHTVTLPATSNTSAGTNWLIAGSDTRIGVSRTEQAKLHLGSTGASASDSLMLLHTGSGGKPVLISIPRDSYVDIPGHGDNKINAALALGGPALLVQTVENLTGLKINHYMSIGFVGLASVVNSVGGVHICLKTAFDDPDSGAHLKAGCQTLNGTEAIAFVRDRHSFADSDLQRIQDQRAFLAALLNKGTSPGVYLNPFTALPFASTSASSIAIDKGTSLYNLLQVAFALKNPETGTVPVANANFETNAGDAVELDKTKALELFDDLKDGKTVPSSLLSGTKVG
jgi:LCP family protein required for cell wall assembly